MIIKIFSLENDIDFSKRHVNVLQIQSKKLFAKMVNSFNDLCNGVLVDNNETITVLEDDLVVDCNKKVIFVIDFLNFDFSQRKIQSALYQYIDKICKLEPEILQNINNLKNSMQIELMNITEELSFEVMCKDDITISDLLKMYGIKIQINEGEGIVEKLFRLVELIQCMDLARLLICVNLKQYLNDEQLVEFYKYCVYNDVRVLLLENGLTVSALENERVLFVDEDYDEFVFE